MQSAASRGAVIQEEGEPLLPLSEPHIKQLLAVRWGGRHGGNSSSPWSQYIERRSKEVVVKIETGSLHVPLNTLESRASLAARCANPDGEEVFIVTIFGEDTGLAIVAPQVAHTQQRLANAHRCCEGRGCRSGIPRMCTSRLTFSASLNTQPSICDNLPSDAGATARCKNVVRSQRCRHERRELLQCRARRSQSGI